MEVKDLVRVFVKGGILTPADFLKVLLTAEKAGATCIHFGSRQDILFPASESAKGHLEDLFESLPFEYEINTFTYQNVLSSYVSLDILPGKKWLASHIYHRVIESLDYRPKLRINVVDPSQSLVPLFTGHVNFVASNTENFWYVYLRFQQIQNVPGQMPLLVFTEDLSKLAKALEDLDLQAYSSYSALFEYLTSNVKLNTQPVTEDLLLPEPYFSYYEGLHRQVDEKYWLGLYWRDNNYKIRILKAMAERSISTEVGHITLTPWKSFVIKGIAEKDRLGWEKLMGKFGMNLRHSSLELNWHLPALDKEALDLKFYLVREMDQKDVSTYGLTFTIKTKSDVGLFTSVVIEKVEDEPGLYNILYSKNFNPNLTEYFFYAKKVHKSVLAALILELTLVYYDSLNEEKNNSSKIEQIKNHMSQDMYQCSKCMTVYDANYGDPSAGIAPSIGFINLPADYICPTCGAAKSSYQKMKL